MTTATPETLEAVLRPADSAAPAVAPLFPLPAQKAWAYAEGGFAWLADHRFGLDWRPEIGTEPLHVTMALVAALALLAVWLLSRSWAGRPGG